MALRVEPDSYKPTPMRNAIDFEDHVLESGMRRSVILTKVPFAPYYEDRYFAGLSATQRVPLWTRSPWFAKQI